jgi:hypothetical protein
MAFPAKTGLCIAKKILTIIDVLPKGISVRDASPNGFAAMGLFGPHRFSITVATEERHLVDYNASKEIREYKELYPGGKR